MKRIKLEYNKEKKLLLILFITLTIFTTACSKEDKKQDVIDEKEIKTEIKINEIEWNVTPGTINGENYILMGFKNNSNYDISYLEIKFVEKANITEQEKDSFYEDIKKSQGFDDEWIKEYRESKEKLNQPITMYCKYEETVKKGETIKNVKCYYGGWTSKNVLHRDLFVADKAIIGYENEGVSYKIYYDYNNKTYSLEEN